MIVFLKTDINIKEIEKRFEEIGSKAHRVDLGFKDLKFENYSNIHPNDLDAIVKKIAEDYKTSKADFIYVSGMNIELISCDRNAICYSSEYKMKK